MREFDADYLEDTRRGMWADSRAALSDLDLDSRRCVVDVGCGTGALTRVLASETPSDTDVVGVDADPDLLAGLPDRVEPVQGDATRLPLVDDAADLVACQALLINLPDPVEAVEAFARVSSDLVAAVEPDNAAVTVDSTVAAEPGLERRAREAYLAGVDTDVTLGGSGTREAFAAAGLSDVRTRRYDHTRVVEPPYSERDLANAKRKATGEGLASDRATMLDGAMDSAGYDDLRAAWRSMGRDVIREMGDREYRREETVPFFVTVGRV